MRGASPKPGPIAVPAPVAPKPEPLLLKLPEAAEFLGITVWQLRGLISRKRIRVVDVNGAFFISRKTLVRFIETAEEFAA
jgi:hypothetical protein